MSATTPVLGLHYPVLSDQPNVPSDIQTLATDLENLLTGWQVLDSCELSATTAPYTAIAGTETDLPKLRLGPVSLKSGNLYRFDFDLILQAAAGTEGRVRVRSGAAVTGTLIGEGFVTDPGGGQGFRYVSWFDYEATSTASVTFYVSLVRATGSGTYTVYGQVGTQTRTRCSVKRVGFNTVHRVVA